MVFQPVRVSAVAAVAAVVPVVAANQSKTFMPAAVKPGEMQLPPEAKAMVPKLVDSLLKSRDVLDYGQGATVKVAQFSDRMLSQVSMMNIGDFQKPLTDVLVLCGTVNAQSIQNGKLNSRIPFMNRVKLWFAGAKARAISNINSVKDQIGDIEKELVKKEGDLRKNIDMMEELYMLNMQEYYALQAHIEALEHVIKTKQGELVRFQEEFASNQDPLAALEVSERRDFIDALDKKLYDLRAISLMCLDTAPQIRGEQKSSVRSIEKFRSVRSMAIPLWKKQAAIMLSSLENSRAATLGKQIDDTTNNMVKSNATQTAANTVATAKLGQRGVLDLETMEHVNAELIKSIQELVQIEEEGKQYRANAATRFIELKESLNQNVVQRGMS